MPEFNKEKKFETKDVKVDFADFSRKMREIIKLIKDDEQYSYEIEHRIVKFANGLKAEHPDYIKKKLFHLLVLSSPGKDQVLDEEDYTDEYSIVNFMNELFDEYKIKIEE